MNATTKRINEVNQEKRLWLSMNKIEIVNYYYDLADLFIRFNLNGVELVLDLNDKEVEELLPFDVNVIEFDGFNIVYNGPRKTFLTYSEYFETLPNAMVRDFVAVHFALGRRSQLVNLHNSLKQTA